MIKNRQKIAFFVFGHFWAYVGQPYGHIGWATSMPFASINFTNLRINPWNFHKKILRIGDFEKRCFLSWPFWFLNFDFCFCPIKTSQILLFSKDRSKFWASRMWQHFLTQTKHFEGECITSMYISKTIIIMGLRTYIKCVSISVFYF